MGNTYIRYDADIVQLVEHVFAKHEVVGSKPTVCSKCTCRYMDTKTCPKCLAQHTKSSTYCSRSCANSRTFSQTTRSKKSDAAKRHAKTAEGQAQLQERRSRNAGKQRSETAKQKTREWKQADTIKRYEAGLISTRSALRQILASQRGYKCEVCEIVDWLGSPITLQVDHINGDPSDNSPINLRLICPNCHSQTPNWGAKNKGSGRKKRGIPLY